MKPQHIRNLLGHSPSAASPLRPAAEFWSEFRIRARDQERTQAVEPPRFTGARFFRGVAPLGAAAAAAILLVSLWPVGPDIPEEGTGAVRSFHVSQELAHSGILILNDEPSQATILWIADCAERA